MTIDVNPEASRETLLGWISQEQLSLWHDLSSAIDASRSRAWSMASANFARRIVETTLFVPPADPQSVPWPIYAGGVWRAVLVAGDVEGVPPHDQDEFAALDAEMVRLGAAPAAECVERYVETLRYIASPRETNWIRGGDE